MKKNVILFWDSSVSDMLSGKPFGGIAVQLKFWMQSFAKNGWEVHALSTLNSYNDENIIYHHIRHFPKIEFLWEWITILHIISIVNPEIIIFRGAKRLLYPLSIIAHKFNSKVILQGASDVNFESDKATVGNDINRRLYERSLTRIDYFICQNVYQATTLKENFHRESVIIPNIWGQTSASQNLRLPDVDVVWVGNFRRLKRAEWLYEAAENLKQVKFAIAGGAANLDYYKSMEKKASSLQNVSFLGKISINDSNALIKKAKILVCTSEYEGFPNTFLQAWSSGIPVISTVDPSGIIKKYSLGIVVSCTRELVETIKLLLDREKLYEALQQSVKKYFASHHSAQKGYDALIKMIYKK